MEILTINEKHMVLRIIFAALDFKPIEIARDLNVAKSVVSRHFHNVRAYDKVDLYIIEKIFGIRVKEYERV